MGGRGSFGGKNMSINGLRDSNNFNDFIRQNMGNAKFMELGREGGMKAVKELWYSRQFSKENIHELSKEEAIEIVRDSIPSGALHGWFVEANSDYKERIVDSIAGNPGTLNAGLNIAYRNYVDSSPKDTMSFQKWLNTPQTLYRGDRGQKEVQADIFRSYTPSRKVAESFGSHVTSIRIKPIDTLGSYQTTAEQEFLVRT